MEPASILHSIFRIKIPGEEKVSVTSLILINNIELNGLIDWD